MSVDLSVEYLGLHLEHPVVSGASPLAGTLDGAKRLEDGGASAIVLHSLFEEQLAPHHKSIAPPPEGDAYTDALAHITSAELDGNPDFALGPEQLVEHLRRVREAVRIPVIASLNGTAPGPWLDHAKLLEQAGAQAIELNLYEMSTDPNEDGPAVEKRLLDVVRETVARVRIPVAVKLSPYHTALPHFAGQLEQAGAQGLVLFNRFYQPDLDLETLGLRRALRLSDSSELLVRLRWLALLSAQRSTFFAASGGVHTPEDVVKALLVGADSVQVVSASLRHGPARLGTLRDGLRAWLEENEQPSVRELVGKLDLGSCADPHAYERTSYEHLIQTWARRRHGK
jgi:dihydroorotate dehydrogenase (fumarate)